MKEKLKTAIRDLKDELPERGYAILIKQYLYDSGHKKFSIDKIHNFFQYKAVNKEDQKLIVKAAKAVIKALPAKEEELLDLIENG